MGRLTHFNNNRSEVFADHEPQNRTGVLFHPLGVFAALKDEQKTKGAAAPNG